LRARHVVAFRGGGWRPRDPPPAGTRQEEQTLKTTLKLAALLLTAFSSAAFAQDIRGMENCMAEKQMERRTGCLQANNEFLQQELVKLKRDAQDKLAAAGRDAAAAKAEIAALKAAVAKLDADLAALRAAKPDNAAKPDKKP
jgi:hypothetical protein